MSEKDYEILRQQVMALAEENACFIPLMSNVSALVMESMKDLNWAGFYLTTGSEELVLGPFQGKVACIRIKKGHGVCGTAYEKDQQVLVKNVHDFPGHIACDAASLSEVVTPIHNASGLVRAVLDLDSPLEGRFTETDAAGLQKVCDALAQVIRWEVE